MRTGFKFATLFLTGVLCLGTAFADSTQKHKKAKKTELPPLPSGPMGPLKDQVPLDSIPAVPPEVTYKDGRLAIVAHNSTLADILRAVRKQTGAEMDIPSNATERVVTRLGPGPAREIVAALLNGSRFNYVLLGSVTDASLLTRVVLVPKTGPDNVGGPQPPNQPGTAQAFGGLAAPAQPQPDASMTAESNDDSADENSDDSDQNAESDQPAPSNPEQQGVRTPQQILQEMQQRQLQMQQQQQQQQGQGQGQANPPQGYPPQPGAPVPVPQRPPQQEQQ